MAPCQPRLQWADMAPLLTIGTPGTIVPPYANVLKNARRSEESGAETIWFPDHLMGFWPQSIWTPDITPLAAQGNPHVHLDPFVTMAAAATATSRVKLGVAVTQPLSRHPAHLAQTFLSLSHLSGGRAILGLGSGEAENLSPYGSPTGRGVSRMEEALHIIRLLWGSTEPVSLDGEFWPLRDAVLGLPVTTEAPAPPIWLAALGPRMLRFTGKYADGWLPLKMPAADYADKLGLVHQAAPAAGGSRKNIVPGAWAFTVIAENEGDVERLISAPLIKAVCLMFSASSFQRHGLEHPLGTGKEGFRDYIPTRLSREEALAAIGRVPLEVVRDHLLVGTAEQIAAELTDLAEAGLRHAVLWNITFLADASKVRSSFGLLEEITAAVSR